MVVKRQPKFEESELFEKKLKLLKHQIIQHYPACLIVLETPNLHLLSSFSSVSTKHRVKKGQGGCDER